MKINKRLIIAVLVITFVGVSSIILVWVNILPGGERGPPDLTDKGGTYSGFTPTAVKPGSTNFQVWCTIDNLGQSSTGDFNVSYYASTNTIISTDDYLMGSDRVSSISSLNERFSTWSGIFPNSGIPDGIYYIGWIIDSEDEVNEFNETNNLAYVSSYQLIVGIITELTDKGATYSGFTPTAVEPGSTNFQVWSTIDNLGQSSTGDFNVSYYASTNTIISTDDYLMGSDRVSSISSLNYSSSMWSGIFPSSGVPDGLYYIGWIIDSEDEVNEFNETNNIAYVSSYQLIVDSINSSSYISYTPESLPNIVSKSTTFTLLADDGIGSGVDSIKYRIDNGIWTSYTGPFTLEGYAKRNHTIEYYSIDNIGHNETVNREIVNLDIPYLYSGVLFAPGAPIDTPEDRIIKIGVLADLNDITGEGTFQGTYLAIRQINEAGGINITNSTNTRFPKGIYYLGLVAENTYEAEPYLDITKAINATEKMMSEHNPDFVIGGFRTESVLAYREIIMDERRIFIGTGDAADSLCLSVNYNYSRYKYWFRAMPINGSSFTKEIIKFYALVLKPALEAAKPGLTVNKTAIIREDLQWTAPISNILNGYYVPYGYYGLNNNPWFNFTIVDEIPYPITATSADFTNYLNRLQNNEAQIVCPLISAQGGIKMMTQYDQLRPNYMIAGIDYMAQLGDDPYDVNGYWNETDGGCAYEILMQSTTRTNKTTLTEEMWDDYVEMWHMDPLYTAIGSYDSVFMLFDAISTTQSIDSDKIVAQLETINKANPMEGVGGNIAFNANHDLIEGYDPILEKIYSIDLWVQWQSDGTKYVVTSAGSIYPEWIVEAPIQIPPWL